MAEKKQSNYDASNITILEGLKAVRKRPAMYIGSQDINGAHQLVYEVLDNSIDEAMAGHCDSIDIDIRKDNSVVISDDGRGIPVENHPKQNKPAVEVVLTVLHAGGKFDNDSYKVSGGLHGVGISVVNALSEFLEVTIYKHGKVYHQKFERGTPTTKLQDKGKLKKKKTTGTKIKFKPDKEIFENINLNTGTLVKRFEELAYLNSGLRLNVDDERDGQQYTFKKDGGIRSFVESINEGEQRLHKPFYGSSEIKGVSVEFCLQYHAGVRSEIYTFANNIRTKEGGVHFSGFKTALTRTINNYIQKSEELPKKYHQYKITGDDVLESLGAVVNVKIPDPQFEGQTKTKLGNSEVTKYVSQIAGEYFDQHLNENPKEARVIIDKVIESANSRDAAKKAKDLFKRKSALSSSALPGKLADCQSKNPSETELFVVEGDSAGGSAKQGRDPKIQAILPLKGKIINVEKTRFDKMLKNVEIQHLITALGPDPTEDDPDISKLRYNRIIIMTDADVDGAHIKTLLLTFFYRQFPTIIENGHLFIANPPLYRVYKSKFEKYIADDLELRNFLIKNISKDIEVIKGNDKLSPLLNKIAKLRDKLREAVNVGIDENLFLTLTQFDHKLNESDFRQKRNGKSKRLKEYLNENDYVLSRKTVGGVTKWEIVDWNAKKTVLGPEFFSTALYQNTYSLVEEFRDFHCKLKLKSGETKEFTDQFSLLDYVLETAYKKFNVQRYKGLGEMNPEQLWKTTMKEENRNLVQVSVNDAEEANKLFKKLMGEQVEPRRDFIERNALAVEQLDI